MTKVFRCKDGPDPWAMMIELPLSECLVRLGDARFSFLSDLSKPPGFGDQADAKRDAGFRHVVLEVSEAEARPGWNPGYYGMPDTSVGEAARKLGVKL